MRKQFYIHSLSVSLSRVYIINKLLTLKLGKKEYTKLNKEDNQNV